MIKVLKFRRSTETSLGSLMTNTILIFDGLNQRLFIIAMPFFYTFAHSSYSLKFMLCNKKQKCAFNVVEKLNQILHSK